MGLFLSKGVSRMPVIGEDVDEVLGILYLRDVARMSYEKPRNGRERHGARPWCGRPCSSRSRRRSTTCCGRCSWSPTTWPWSSTSTAASPAW